MLDFFTAALPLILSIVVAFKAEEVNKQSRWKVIILAFGVVCTGLIFWQQQRSANEVDRERKTLNNSIDALKEQGQSTQVRNAADMAYLKAKLEDALSKPGTPAVDVKRLGGELAKANLDLIDRESQKLNNKQLSGEVIAFAAKMRSFEAKYANLESAALREKNFGVDYYMKIHIKEDLEFKNEFLGRALAYRDELESRLKISSSDLTPLQQIRLGAFDGFLAGVAPVSDAADYLESLARKLSP